MRKSEKSIKRKKATLNRTAKRCKRLRKTQAEKPIRKKIVLTKKKLDKKREDDRYKEHMNKILQSRLNRI